MVNASLPKYDRMYSWWMLVRTWASLRFDDHRGLIPTEMSMHKGDFSAVLTRSKCSGDGKAIEALPVHISAGCYLGEPTWLQEGFGLWQRVPADRDCLLILPSVDRESTVKVEVSYADAIAMTKAILLSLLRPVSTLGGGAGAEHLTIPLRRGRGVERQVI